MNRTAAKRRRESEARMNAAIKRCRIGIDRNSKAEIACFSSDGFDGVAINPRATPLAVESMWLATMIEDLSGGLIEADTPHGVSPFEIGKPVRTATNEECALINLRLAAVPSLPLDRLFDTRKRMPKAVAKWLRQIAAEMSERLAAIADQVELIKDDRDLSLIKRFVDADAAVKYCGRRGLVDIMRPLPPPRYPVGTPNATKCQNRAIGEVEQ